MVDQNIQQADDVNVEIQEITDRPQSFINESTHDVPMVALSERVYRLYENIDEKDSEVCILFVDDAEIKELNAQWRNVDESTDVLSFPMREGEDPKIAKQLPLGDIVISIETAERYVESLSHKNRLEEAEIEGGCKVDNWTLLDELSFLVVHGTLHLLGYDHAEPEEEREMRRLEAEWFQKIRD